MNVSFPFDSEFCVQLSLALLHFVWQGALIVAGAVLAAWLAGRGSPQRRYCIHLTALALMLLCLPVTLGVVAGRSTGRKQPVAANLGPAVFSAGIETDETPRRDSAWSSSDAPGRTEPVTVPPEATTTAPWLRKEALARWTVWGYLAGVAVMFARVCLAVLGGRRLRLRASPLSEPDLLQAIRTQMARLGLRIVPSVAWCDRVLVPVVIGTIKPAILLPASLATGLTPGQLQLVIAHELAHLCRWDHIAFVFQRVVEAVFFFHPAVWYISRRLSVERELCCDELVLRAGSNAGEYAESLLRVAELSRPAATAAPLVAVAMARGGRGSRALVQRLSRILGQPECSPVRLANPWPLAVGLAVCLGAALICGSAGSYHALAQADSTEGKTPRANENGADDTPVDSAVEKNAVAALRAMHVRTFGDLNTTPLRTVEFWGVPAEAWQHIDRLSSLRELRIVASDVRGRPSEQIGGLKNLRRLSINNSKCSPTDLTRLGGLTNLEHLEIAFTVFEESHTWRSGQLGPLTPGEQEQIDRYLASRPTDRAEHYRRMVEVAVLTDRALQHLRGLKRLRTIKLINTNITGYGLDGLKDLPALEELDVNLIAFSADAARVLGGMQSLRRFRYADVGDEHVAEIARLSRLEELELFGDGVTDQGAEHLRRLTNLRKLSIRGSQLTDDGLRQFAGLPHLEYLDLRHSVGALSDVGVKQFQTQKPGCQVLFQPAEKKDRTPPNRPVATSQDKGTVENAPAKPPIYSEEFEGSVTPKQLEPAPQRPHETGQTTTADAMRVAHSEDAAALEDLAPALIEAFLDRVETRPPPRRGRISRHSRNERGAIISLRLSDANLEKADFALIGQLRELETLDLSRTNVTDDDLRPLGGLPKLRELKLWGARLDGSGLKHLSGLEGLERLDMGDTKVTDESLRHLTELGNLHHLVLVRALVGDAGLEHVAQMGGLRSLKLTGTKVTDEGLRSLRRLGDLRGLTLDDTAITDAGLKYLAESPRFAWAASATATAEEFVRRIERGDHTAVAEMYAVGLTIPDQGQFREPKLVVPLSEADQARGSRRYRLEMRWTWEAEKIDTTFYADFSVDRATIIVHQMGIDEHRAATKPPTSAPTNPPEDGDRKRWQTISGLVSALGDEDAQTAEFASAALARMGKPAVGALIGCLDSDNSQKRKLAANALARIGKPAEAAVPELIKLLQDREGRVCNEAAKALGSFAPEHKEAIPHLMQTMKTYGSNYVATSAAQSLGKFGLQVLPLLREVLRDEQSEARYAVKWALEAMGRQEVTEGTVLYVFPDGRLRVWLGGEGALKVGDLLHVRRPADEGTTAVAALIVVKATEGVTAICHVLQVLEPKEPPIRGGEVVTRGRGGAQGESDQSQVARPVMEGLVLDVAPGQEVSISLCSDDGSKVGDTLHVRRQAPGGSSPAWPGDASRCERVT